MWTTKGSVPGTAAIDQVQLAKRVSGAVGDDGVLQFVVDLTSVEIDIPFATIVASKRCSR
ncbi:hypothetical protein [Burkholderia orbicola]|uniref:hypothetical protein n=1 Tax=Burkholderia orbicola TaxID=2978683 RepID=UPI003AF6EDB3